MVGIRRALAVGVVVALAMAGIGVADGVARAQSSATTTFDRTAGQAGTPSRNHVLEGAGVEPPMEPKWAADARWRMLSTPIIVGDVVVIVTLDEVYHHTLTAFDLATGSIRWRIDIHEISGEIQDGQSYIADDDTVYVFMAPGVLAAVEASSGRIRWEVDYAPAIACRVRTPPALADGVVYAVMNCHDTVALDAATGAVIWHREVGIGYQNNALLYEPAVTEDAVVYTYGTSSATVPAVIKAISRADGSDLWWSVLRRANEVVADDGELWTGTQVFDARTGAEIAQVDPTPFVWRHAYVLVDDLAIRVSDAQPVVPDDVVEITAWMRSDPSTVAWSSFYGSDDHGPINEPSRPLVADGLLYIRLLSRVVAIEPTSGRQVWESPNLNDLVPLEWVATGGTRRAGHIGAGAGHLAVTHKNVLIVFGPATDPVRCTIELGDLPDAHLSGDPLAVTGAVSVSGPGLLSDVRLRLGSSTSPLDVDVDGRFELAIEDLPGTGGVASVAIGLSAQVTADDGSTFRCYLDVSVPVVDLLLDLQAGFDHVLARWSVGTGILDDPVLGYLLVAEQAGSVVSAEWVGSRARSVSLAGTSTDEPITVAIRPLTLLGVLLDPVVATIDPAAGMARGAARPPGPPASLATTTWDGAVTATWDAPFDDGGRPISAYVAIALDAAGGHVTGSAVVASDSLSVSIAGLDRKRPVDIVVLAISDAGWGEPAWVNGVAAIGPRTELPGRVPWLSMQRTAGGGAGVRWLPPASDGGTPIDGYHVLTTQSGALRSWEVVGPGERGATITGLTSEPATVYVVPANRNGFGPLASTP